MKKITQTLSCILILLFFINYTFAGNNIGYSNTGDINPDITLISSDNDYTDIKFNINSYNLEKVLVNGNIEYIVTSPKASAILKAGAPDLPKLTTSIIIPDNAMMDVEILYSDFIEINDIDIAPSKGNLYRDQDPNEIDYAYGEEYNKNEFYPSSISELRTPHILRDYRGQTVIVKPFQYNPVTKTLRIYKDITVRVKKTDNNGINTLNRTKSTEVIDETFNQIYKDHFLNYTQSRYTPIEEEAAKILVISAPDYMDEITPYVEWKKLKGIPTEIVDVTTIGDANAIKTYITNYYNSNNVTFVLLVGDAEDVPSLNADGNSDAAYGHITGNDTYAEIFIGRFSAESTGDVATQVERTIHYEKDMSTSATWIENAIGIASAEGEGSGDDGESDIEHMDNIKTDLTNYGYVSVDQVYDLGASATTVTESINEGRGILNYIGHGSDTEFVTTGFSNSDVNNLTNVDKLPFIFDVACVNGNFHGQTCFAESWLRATSGDKPTGAVAIIASTINQSWVPPMAAQDEMIDILVDSYVNNVKRTFGGITINGCMQMNDEYGTLGDKITNTWTIFGDPSLMVRTKTPQIMTVDHPSATFIGSSSVNVNCNIDHALISLTIDGEIIGTAFSNEGFAIVNFDELTSTGTIDIVITAFNQVTYIGQIEIVPASGPYVYYNTHAINDASGNNNLTAEFGENILLSISLENAGIDNASSVTATLTTSDEYITITDNNHSYGDINESSIINGADGYEFSIDNNIPDAHIVTFELTIADNNNTWNSTFTITLSAPTLDLSFINIDDGVSGNGLLDASETVDLTFNVLNNGSAISSDATMTISSTSSYVTINTTSNSLGQLAIGSTTPSVFNITVDPSTPISTVIEFQVILTAGDYSETINLELTVGLIIEDWESNTFTSFDWSNNNSTPWIITDEYYKGSFAAKSGAIDDSKSTTLEITVDVLSDNNISFYKKVSCEDAVNDDWDYLSFSIDNIEKGRWDGENNWSFVEYPINTGIHTLSWTYTKDNMSSDGSDCAWIDYIVLPPHAIETIIDFTSSDIKDIKFDIYPNPINNHATINFDLPETTDVSISLVNMLGEELKTVFNKSNTSEGSYNISFNSNNLNSGIYYCIMKANNQSITKKIVITK